MARDDTYRPQRKLPDWWKPGGDPQPDRSGSGSPGRFRPGKPGKRRDPRPRRPGDDGKHRRRHPRPALPDVPPERPARPALPESPRVKPPGVRLPRLPRAPIPWFWAPDAIDWFDRGFVNPDPGKPPRLPGNYVWCKGPITPNLSAGGWPFTGGHFFGFAGACSIPVPTTGQSPVAPAPVSALEHYWWRNYTHPFAGLRGEVHGVILRVGGAVSPQPQPYPLVIGPAGLDPNGQRYSPISPTPYPDYVPPSVPALEPGVGEGLSPAGDPQALSHPGSPYSPDAAWGYQLGLGITYGMQPGSGAPQPPADPKNPRLPPVTRDPPQRRERQRKVLSRTATLGIALFRALDAISEGAEVVDALYDALPDDVKKRWNKAHADDAKNRRLLDTAGQYGIDAADWKLQALYWNWHRLDVEQAVKNILKNHLSDSMIGRIQRELPRNTGNALSQGEKELSKLLDDWLSSELGL